MVDSLVCPKCHSELGKRRASLACESCNILFSPNEYGYYEFVPDKSVFTIDSTTGDYAHAQELASPRFFREFLKPYALREQIQRILDVGTGVGGPISQLARMRYEAYGTDLPNLCSFWAEAGNDPQMFLCCEATQMPFKNDYFDLVYSLGVIEHVGTEDGHGALSAKYWEARQRYANEIVRVTKPGGRILISCPNKSFPIDIQHGPPDDLSAGSRLRRMIWRGTKMNFHPIWGKHHLLSYSETRRLFCMAGARSFDPLPLRGFFGFSRFQSGFLKYLAPLVETYVNNLPRVFLSTFVNCYLLVEIRK